MEAKTKSGCSFPSSGSISYRDDYDIIYYVTWETTNSGLDITTVIHDGRVPGQVADGYRDGYALFRRGLITIKRQIIVITDVGYTIISEGDSQEIGYFQSTFPCGPRFVDPFCYHLDNAMSSDVEIVVSCGPRWTDPDVVADDDVTWGDVDLTDGLVVAESIQNFQWVDVWGQTDDLQSTCP